VRTSTGFHRYNAGRQVTQKVSQPVPLKALAKHNCAIHIQSCKAANRLAQINA
jgi:hypothetical protein